MAWCCLMKGMAMSTARKLPSVLTPGLQSLSQESHKTITLPVLGVVYTPVLLLCITQRLFSRWFMMKAPKWHNTTVFLSRASEEARNSLHTASLVAVMWWVELSGGWEFAMTKLGRKSRAKRKIHDACVSGGGQEWMETDWLKGPSCTIQPTPLHLISQHITKYGGHHVALAYIQVHFYSLAFSFLWTLLCFYQHLARQHQQTVISLLSYFSSFLFLLFLYLAECPL